MASGKSLELKKIGPKPPQVLYEHNGGPGPWFRRHFQIPGGAVVNRPKNARLSTDNVPYVNPARDLKPTRKRRLRKELRADV